MCQKASIKHGLGVSFHKGLVTLDVHCMVSFRSVPNLTPKLALEICGLLHKRQIVDILEGNLLFLDQLIEKTNRRYLDQDMVQCLLRCFSLHSGQLFT